MKRIIVSLLLFLSMSVFPRWTPLEFRTSDTGKVIGDFTLVYQRINYDATATPHLTVTNMSTAGITVVEAGGGVYLFDGLDDDDTRLYLFRATITANGHYDERWIPWAGPAPATPAAGTFSLSTSSTQFWQADTPTLTVAVAAPLDCHGAVLTFTLENQSSNTFKVLTGASAITDYGLSGGCNINFTFTAADTGMADCATAATSCAYWGQFTMAWAGPVVHSTDRYTITVRKK